MPDNYSGYVHTRLTTRYTVATACYGEESKTTSAMDFAEKLLINLLFPDVLRHSEVDQLPDHLLLYLNHPNNCRSRSGTIRQGITVRNCFKLGMTMVVSFGTLCSIGKSKNSSDDTPDSSSYPKYAQQFLSILWFLCICWSTCSPPYQLLSQVLIIVTIRGIMVLPK